MQAEYWYGIKASNPALRPPALSVRRWVGHKRRKGGKDCSPSQVLERCFEPVDVWLSSSQQIGRTGTLSSPPAVFSKATMIVAQTRYSTQIPTEYFYSTC
jgi:hypothetical protein